MRKSLLVIVALCVGSLTARPGGLGQTNASPRVDGRSICVPYDPAGLTITDIGGGAWDLRRADGAIFKNFDNRHDAEAGLAVARLHTQLCYIGKSNTRPDRGRYIMEYWK